MKKISILLFSLAIGMAVMLGVSSCDDGTMENTIIKGHILEYGTEAPIAGAKVILLEEEASWTGGYRHAIDTITTDASGYYEYDFIEKAGFFYWVDVVKDGYHELPTPFYDFKSNQVNDANIYLDPLAALELHIKNVNPYNENDRFGLAEFCGGSYPEFRGINIDTTIMCIAKGNQDNIIIFWVYKDGVDISYRDTVYCKGHELTTHNILY